MLTLRVLLSWKVNERLRHRNLCAGDADLAYVLAKGTSDDAWGDNTY